MAGIYKLIGSSCRICALSQQNLHARQDVCGSVERFRMGTALSPVQMAAMTRAYIEMDGDEHIAHDVTQERGLAMRIPVARA